MRPEGAFHLTFLKTIVTAALCPCVYSHHGLTGLHGLLKHLCPCSFMLILPASLEVLSGRYGHSSCSTTKYILYSLSERKSLLFLGVVRITELYTLSQHLLFIMSSSVRLLHNLFCIITSYSVHWQSDPQQVGSAALCSQCRSRTRVRKVHV